MELLHYKAIELSTHQHVWLFMLLLLTFFYRALHFLFSAMSEYLPKERVLIVDDDHELCELLVDYLEQEDIACHFVNDGLTGLEEALINDFSLVILDVMLPGLNGFEVLRSIRRSSQIPVIMLTAKGEDVDRIVGLEMGADDYMAKPFNPRELVARIRAIARRNNRYAAQPEQQNLPVHLSYGDVTLDAGTRTVTQNGKIISLTSVEFSMLQELLNNIGKVVQRDQLAISVLGRKLEEFDRSIDVHISSLRKKLGHQVNGIERIKNVRGVGYQYTTT
jgi:two-component system response regulator CpxR